MVNHVVIWLCAHPLEWAGLLAFVGVLVGAMLIPRLHELADHHPPRC
jgi:hypothetical protein